MPLTSDTTRQGDALGIGHNVTRRCAFIGHNVSKRCPHIGHNVTRKCHSHQAQSDTEMLLI
ncbi:hypothetical protein DPMN_108090 [Dreissena polymorpha]|uniref:Uncharacterized protein n=1 Tax=Dreissena polymorpha TaxID=45954 RepID=A0A9D4K7W3_DREPO|nr:hypothetical protein DPMN_108090 [Dreissena polymorpha]